MFMQFLQDPVGVVYRVSSFTNNSIGGPYPPATYGPGRGHDYSADRRPNHPPLPSGGPGAYYRGGEPAVPRY